MLSENSTRSEDDHQDQNAEQHRLSPFLTREEPEAAVVQRLDDTDQHATDHRAEQVADPAEHGCGEGNEAKTKAGVVASLPVDLHKHGARGTGKGAAERKHVRDDL